MLMVVALGFSSAAYSSETEVLPKTTSKVAEQIATCIKSVPKYSLFLWSTLLKSGVKRFNDMKFATGAVIDFVVWAAIAYGVKIAYDKYQKHKQQVKEHKGLQEILEAYDKQQVEENDSEEVPVQK